MLQIFCFWKWRSSLGLCLVNLLLLLLGFEKSVSESIIQSHACGSDIITYSTSSIHDLFSINGNLVDRESFCKALESHYLNGCTVDRYLEHVKCGLDLSSAGFPFKGGRKILQKDTSKGLKPIHLDVQSTHSTDDEHSKNSTAYKEVTMVVPGILVCCVLLCPCFFKRRKGNAEILHARGINSMDSTSSLEMNSVSEKVQPSPLRVPPSPSRFSMSPKHNTLHSVHLNLSQVARATRNFSKEMIIGEGGFGTVFKAQLEDGQVVAVKRAKKEHFGGLRAEFSSEVQLLSKIDHRSLVKLLGYVDKGNELLIITEYVPSGTLRKHLDGQGGKILDFNQRLEIAIDIAHGLTYLHSYTERQIIHRDVKSSNILLTNNLRAKVADFGFAKLGPMDSDRTHVSTKVKGTIGYLDPEYMKTYQLTPKSDVYSFGILLLEIFTSRRPVEVNRPPDERVTLRWAFKKYNERNVEELVDPLMDEAVDAEILTKIFGLAFQCAAPIRSDRPEMKSVGEQLWAIRADYLKSVKRG